MTSVAIEIAQFYLVQGQFILAAKTCEDLSRQSLSHPTRPEEAVTFSLLQAYIGIGRYSKLRTALKVAQDVGEIWRINVEERSSREASDSIKEIVGEDDTVEDLQRIQDLGIDGNTRPDNPLTEYRVSIYPRPPACFGLTVPIPQVLMVFYHWKIMVVAAEQGLLDEKATKAAAVANISPILLQVRAEGRLREARFLIYFKADIMSDPRLALEEMQDFLQCLEDPAWDVERAFTLTDIAEFQLQSGGDTCLAEAEENLRRADEIFARIVHGFGNIDTDLVRISADRTLSVGEKFIAKTKIADRYFDIGHYQNGIRCLAFAISPEMTVDAYHDEVVRALELLDRTIHEAGSEILKQMSLLHSVCQASLKAPEYGFALNSLESYYVNTPEEISSKHHSYLASVLGLVYSSFGEYGKALHAAEQSLELALSGASYTDQSDAATHVGRHRFSLAQQHPRGSKDAIDCITSALDFSKEWAEKDAKNDYAGGEVQKCLLIADLENYRAAVYHPDMDPKSAEQPWIERVKRLTPDLADPLARGPLVDVELRSLMRVGRYTESLELSASYLEQLRKVSGVPPFRMAHAFWSASIQARLCVQNTFQGGETPTPESMQSAEKLLWGALSLSYKALQLYRQTNGVELVLDCTLFVWEILEILTVGDTDPDDLIASFADELNQTEQVCDEMRRSVLPVGGLRNLMNKRLLVAKKASLMLYNVGSALALRLGNPNSAWLWLQKGKARAFADSLGATSAIPPRLLDQLSNDPVAYGLLREEQSILELLQEPNVNHIIAARRLALLRGKMANHPLLAEAARLKDGLFNPELGMDETKEALLKTGLAAERVKFVAWYVPISEKCPNQQIFLVVRQLDGTTFSKQLAIGASQVRDWVREAFQYPDMATPPLRRKTGNRLLKKLNILVQGLSDTTSEGDLLILSPSGPLNGVPLHALEVDGEPLIQRNTVVYVPSAATLSQCLLRVTSPHDKQQIDGARPCSAKYFAVYEEPERKAERESIFTHIKDLSSSFPGTVSLGPEVTKSHFLRECTDAKWVHYHGHARYNKDDVLKSSLTLSDGIDISSRSTQEHAGDTDANVEELFVSELFDAELPRGAVHFTVIACDSGTQEMAPGDEPLGIIPALLYAGATSVLGCLWPIESRGGRAFSEAFYEEVGHHDTSSPRNCLSGVIDLASAMRTTVLKMRRGDLGAEFKQPYYWAPFTLHGLWYFQGQ